MEQADVRRRRRKRLGRERKDDDQTCFCLLPSFLSQRSRSRSAAHFPDNRRSFSGGGAAAREQCADCCLLESVGVTPLPLSAPHVWLLAAFTVPLDDGKGTASYRKYVAHFKATAGFTPHGHDQDRRPAPWRILPRRPSGLPANAYARLA